MPNKLAFVLAFLCINSICWQILTSQIADADNGEDWQGSAFVAGRWNPMGLSLEADFGPKFELYPSEEELFKLNFLKPYFFFGISPARLHTGVGLELQPLSFFGIKAFAGQAGTFGTYGHLQIFSDSHPNWKDQTRKEKVDTKEEQNSLQKIANWYVAQAYLQARAGQFAAKFSYGIQRYEFDLKEEYRYFFDVNDDMLSENRKWNSILTGAIVCDSYQETMSVKLGVSARSLHAGYTRGSDRWTLKWGPFMAYQWEQNQTLFGALQWAPHHEIRKASGPKGVPAIVLGHNSNFSF